MAFSTSGQHVTSGKSTLEHAALRLFEPTSGELEFDGRNLRKEGPQALRRLRRRMQLIFQDPAAVVAPSTPAVPSLLIGVAGRRRLHKTFWRGRALTVPEELGPGQLQVRREAHNLPPGGGRHEGPGFGVEV